MKDVIHLRSDSLCQGYNSFRFFADGYPGIMFIQSENEVYLNINECKLSSFFLHGQTVKPIEIGTTGPFKGIVFMLYPHAVKSLFGIDALQLTDTCIEVSRLPYEGAKELNERLSEASGTSEQIGLIASFLLKVKESARLNTDPTVHQAVSSILQSKGRLPLSKLLSKLNVTERTLQRKFLENVGVSPQLFARITWFKNTFDQLKPDMGHSLTEIAYRNDFADQSHFNRIFKEFTGTNPRAYLAQFSASFPSAIYKMSDSFYFLNGGSNSFASKG